MTKHLTGIEHVDLLDGRLPAARAGHVAACEACRAASEELREVLSQAAQTALPEPSPLFWDHLSARVREGVRGADTSAASEWRGWFAGWTESSSVRWGMAGALLTVVLVGGVWRASAPRADRPAPAQTASYPAPNGDPVGVAALGADAEVAWSLVSSVADDVLSEDVSWDRAATEGLGVRPGSAERAMGALTGAERSELVRLLEAATKQPGA
jgi:hypothetical protein